MPRAKVSRTGGVLAGAALLALVTGLAVRTLLSPSASDTDWPTTPASMRQTDATTYTTSSKILFDIDSATLRPEATPALRAIVAQIEKRSPGAVLGVEGHTDDTGPNERNERLSYLRASRVATWLVEDAGIARSRIKVYALGSRFPAYRNDSVAHRQANRRVVIAAER
jgi:outer membrane protein OmpA-like peptidoglycan-associated protein